MPGLDPTKDLNVSVAGGVLNIRAQRPTQERIGAHSEFHYGSLGRTVPLPRQALAETATGHYAQGILEITFALGEPQPAGRPITIRVARPSRSPSRPRATAHR